MNTETLTHCTTANDSPATLAVLAELFPCTSWADAARQAKSLVPPMTIRKYPGEQFADVFPRGFGNESHPALTPSQALYIATAKSLDTARGRFTTSGCPTITARVDVIAQAVFGKTGVTLGSMRIYPGPTAKAVLVAYAPDAMDRAHRATARATMVARDSSIILAARQALSDLYTASDDTPGGDDTPESDSTSTGGANDPDAQRNANGKPRGTSRTQFRAALTRLARQLDGADIDDIFPAQSGGFPLYALADDVAGTIDAAPAWALGGDSDDCPAWAGV